MYLIMFDPGGDSSPTFKRVRTSKRARQVVKDSLEDSHCAKNGMMLAVFPKGRHSWQPWVYVMDGWTRSRIPIHRSWLENWHYIALRHSPVLWPLTAP